MQASECVNTQYRITTLVVYLESGKCCRHNCLLLCPAEYSNNKQGTAKLRCVPGTESSGWWRPIGTHPWQHMCPNCNAREYVNNVVVSFLKVFHQNKKSVSQEVSTSIASRSGSLSSLFMETSVFLRSSCYTVYIGHCFDLNVVDFLAVADKEFLLLIYLFNYFICYLLFFSGDAFHFYALHLGNLFYFFH